MHRLFPWDKIDYFNLFILLDPVYKYNSKTSKGKGERVEKLFGYLVILKIPALNIIYYFLTIFFKKKTPS